MGTNTSFLSNVEAEFMKFRIPFPRVTETQEDLDTLRATGRKSIGMQQKILPIFGPSQSGKSTIIKDWRERIQRREKPAAGRHPILHVELTSNATIKSLGIDIIAALDHDALPDAIVDDASKRLDKKRATTREGDVFRDTSIDRVLYQALTALQNANTEVLVIDELHHLVTTNTDKRRWKVTEALKWITLKGVCPLVLVGIDDARTVVDAHTNPQIAGRCLPPVLLSPLNLGDLREKKMFAGYIMALDKKIVEHGLLPQESGLLQGDWLACFHDVSKGVIGTVAHLLAVAVVNAIKRKSSRVELEDLDYATRRWAIPLKHTDDHNPWINGPRDLRVINATGSRS
ncbi:TniB family NTP-binding protein [Methylosinus sp. Ce-a6]|uniref:TniB family NTP-binding protein n=1 Tax=Methylosinus sp. Ce-a6 TaxID=2172005 RepID=UPI00135BD6BB|nr:TniB family NTP-binding protein [Methylosinus sp. Ce-a6]